MAPKCPRRPIRAPPCLSLPSFAILVFFLADGSPVVPCVQGRSLTAAFLRVRTLTVWLVHWTVNPGPGPLSVSGWLVCWTENQAAQTPG